MKVLICTHHLYEWAGSELVSIELFEELQRQGHEARVFCPFVRPAFAQRAFGNWNAVIESPTKVDLADYDLVVVLHQTSARFLHLQDNDVLFGKNRPFFVYLHLSPYESFEAPGLGAQKLLADMVLANSEETRAALADYGYRDVGLFENPAPSRFAGVDVPPKPLKRILSVSNHVPKELNAAFGLLEDRGFEVYRIGSPENTRRIQPYDLFEHDAVITTGKTVQYALRAGRPAYCYDQFQGPGWINQMFDENAATNFSGRCCREVKNPEALAEDIVVGYAAARTWMMSPPQGLAERYHLETHVARIVEAASSTRPNRAAIAKSQLNDIQQRLRLESAIYTHIDRSYEMQTGILSQTVPKPLEQGPVPAAMEMVRLREPGPEEAMIVAVFSFRYEAHLVPPLLENIGPLIHGYVCWDDRMAAPEDAFTDEPARQTALFRAAQKMGADWILPVDPDERFEDAMADNITDMTTKFGPIVWTFEFRELFTNDAYREDGIWSMRPRARLFPCLPGMEPDERALHGSWTRNGQSMPVRASGFNLYHLRMSSPKRRVLRRAQYATLDPERDHQKLGYDYLDDERGMRLRLIPENKGFSPSHVEDHGLWTAQDHYPEAGQLVSDPVDMRLHLLAATRKRGGFAAAMHMALDLHKNDPDDQEFALLAADSAMRAKEWDIAASLAGEVSQCDPEALMAHLIHVRSLLALGRSVEAGAALQRAESLAPSSYFCARERALMLPVSDRFISPDALWRRWVTGHVEIHQGQHVTTCELTVVVISMGAPEDLVASVASLFAQSVVPEIVVVNSKGGDVLNRLTPYADRLRIITVEERLLPGAARNIGIDASAGQFVSFLASDCTVIPDCVKRRLDLHQNGARAVSAFVVPEDETSLFQRVASIILHSTRHPNSGLAAAKKYSLSYDRSLFNEVGYFPTGLRVAEDTYLNNYVATHTEIVSDTAVCISHRYPNDADALRQDMAARAAHRVNAPSFGGAQDAQDLRAKISNTHDERLALTLRILDLRQSEFDAATLRKMRDLIHHMLGAERDAALHHGAQLVQARHLVDEITCGEGADPDVTELLLREAVICQPQSPWLQFRLAQQMMTRDDPESLAQAVAFLQSAVSINPGEPKFLHALIDCLLVIGDETAARDAFERACLMSPGRIGIWETHAALKTAAKRPLRVYCLHQMFFMNLSDANVAATLAENHRRSGNLAARQARARNSGIELIDPTPDPEPAMLPAPRRGLWQRGRSALGRRLRNKWRNLVDYQVRRLRD